MGGTTTAATPTTPVLKHYAVWYGPRFDDIYDCPVESRDPHQYTMPLEADYFRFYDRLEQETELDGRIVKLRSEPFNHSAYYVPGGCLLTDEEKDTAFATSLRPYASDRGSYVVFHTRYRQAVLLYEAEVEFLPG